MLVTALEAQLEFFPKWVLVTERLQYEEQKQKEKVPVESRDSEQKSFVVDKGEEITRGNLFVTSARNLDILN